MPRKPVAWAPEDLAIRTAKVPTPPDASDDMCSDTQQLEFSEVSSGGGVATITSINHETWEGDPPPPGFEPDGTVRVGDTQNRLP